MRSQIDKETTASNGRIDPPGQLTIRRLHPVSVEADGDGTGGANRAGVDQFFHLQETGQATTIVGDPQRHPRSLTGRHHALTFSVVERHWLFHIDRFPCLCHGQCIVLMSIGGRGNIDRVHLGIMDERLGVIIPARDIVATGVIGGQCAITAHDGHQR